MLEHWHVLRSSSSTSTAVYSVYILYIIFYIQYTCMQILLHTLPTWETVTPPNSVLKNSAQRICYVNYWRLKHGASNAPEYQVRYQFFRIIPHQLQYVVNTCWHPTGDKGLELPAKELRIWVIGSYSLRSFHLMDAIRGSWSSPKIMYR